MASTSTVHSERNLYKRKSGKPRGKKGIPLSAVRIRSREQLSRAERRRMARPIWRRYKRLARRAHVVATRNGGLATILPEIERSGLRQALAQLDIEKQGIPAVALCMLFLLMKLVGIPRISYLREEDSYLAHLAGLPGNKMIDQSTLQRFLPRLLPRHLRFLLQVMVTSMKAEELIRGRHIAIDAHFIPYWGQNNPLARFWRGRPGFKLYVVYDLETGVVICYHFTRGNTYDGKLLVPLVKRAERIVGQGHIETIAVDRGFYGGEYFNRLDKDLNVLFVIPAKHYKYLKTFLTECAALLEVEEWAGDETVVFEKAIPHRHFEGHLRLIGVREAGSQRIVAYLTNDWERDAISIHISYGWRWRIENLCDLLKNQVWIDKIPGNDVNKIKAHICFSILAHNLLCFYTRPLGDKWAKREAGTIQRQLLRVPAVALEDGSPAWQVFIPTDYAHWPDLAQAMEGKELVSVIERGDVYIDGFWIKQ